MDVEEHDIVNARRCRNILLEHLKPKMMEFGNASSAATLIYRSHRSVQSANEPPRVDQLHRMRAYGKGRGLHGHAFMYLSGDSEFHTASKS
jgi:hypothetical protein